MAEIRTEGGFALYLHWPFCAAKCPYCDFNSHVAGEIDHAAWRRAYLSEIDRAGAELPGRVLDSIYFGGGTPSLMPPETVAALIEGARRHWRFVNDIEITLEANPGSVEAARFADCRAAGVNRVSLGIQALNDRDLRRLGRIHTAAEARAAWDVAAAVFDRASFDLIYARQDQDAAAWRAELAEALAMSPGHLSLYQLTIEPGTAFHARRRAGGLRGLPEEDLAADLFRLTGEICAAAGLPAYEISNHARPGQESRHNLVYWRQGDYVGIGPGAHGRITLAGRRHATECPRDPARWLAAVAEGSGECARTPLSAAEQAEEYVMMGLRISEGIDPDRYAALAGRPLSPGALARLDEWGMIARTAERRIAATERGRAVLDAVIRELLAG